MEYPIGQNLLSDQNSSQTWSIVNRILLLAKTREYIHPKIQATCAVKPFLNIKRKESESEMLFCKYQDKLDKQILSGLSAKCCPKFLMNSHIISLFNFICV